MAQPVSVPQMDPSYDAQCFENASKGSIGLFIGMLLGFVTAGFVTWICALILYTRISSKKVRRWMLAYLLGFIPLIVTAIILGLLQPESEIVILIAGGVLLISAIASFIGLVISFIAAFKYSGKTASDFEYLCV